VPRVPHKVQRALQRERAEREQKGLVFAGSSGVGGDYAKFEANFSRALTKGDTADAVHVKSRAGGGGGLATSLYSSNRTNNLGGGGGGLETTKAVVVSDNLTATTPTATGRVRKGFSVNLGTFSSASTVGSLTPPRGLATVRDERGGGGGGATTPRSASMSRAALSPRGGGGGSKYSPSSQVPLPPPSAATRCGDGSESAALASPPPPPAKRFDWGGDGDQSTR